MNLADRAADLRARGDLAVGELLASGNAVRGFCVHHAIPRRMYPAVYAVTSRIEPAWHQRETVCVLLAHAAALARCERRSARIPVRRAITIVADLERRAAGSWAKAREIVEAAFPNTAASVRDLRCAVAVFR